MRGGREEHCVGEYRVVRNEHLTLLYTNLRLRRLRRMDNPSSHVWDTRYRHIANAICYLVLKRGLFQRLIGETGHFRRGRA